MTEARSPLPDLTDRGALIVDLLVRYGLLITAAMQAFIGDLKPEAARKFLDRLVQAGWLAKHHFVGGLGYYVLSDAACHRLELKRNGRALRQRPLVKRTLVLLHFARNQHLRLLTTHECRMHLPKVYRPGASNYYFIDELSHCLGWICLDDGKRSQRVYMNAQQTAAKKKTVEELRGLAIDGRFRLLVLTTTEAKANQLRELFEQRPIRGVAVDIASVVGCESLVLDRPRSEVSHDAI